MCFCASFMSVHQNTMQKKDSLIQDKLFLFVLVLLKTSATPFVCTCIFVPVKRFLTFSHFMECCEVYSRKKNTPIHAAGQAVAVCCSVAQDLISQQHCLCAQACVYNRALHYKPAVFSCSVLLSSSISSFCLRPFLSCV